MRVIPREWDEYDIERVRVHDSVSDDEIRRALACHNELRRALAQDAHAHRDVARLIAMVQWQGCYAAGSEDALRWLRDHYTREERREPMRRAFEHEAAHIRRAACLVAWRLHEEYLVETLTSLAQNDEDDTVVTTAVSALSAMPCEAAFRAMHSVAMNPRRHWAARVDAAYMLGQTRRADAIPYLTDIALRCDCERTVDCAREMIAHIQQAAQGVWERFDAHAQRIGRPIPYNRRWLSNQQRREL